MARNEADQAPSGLAVGIVGDSLSALLRIVRRPDFADLFPDIRLVGFAAEHREPKAVEKAESLGVAVFEDAVALARTSGLEMLLDLRSGEASEAEAAKLRQILPPGVCMPRNASARFLWDILTSDRLCAACRTELLATRNLFTTVIDKLEEDILLLDLEGRILDMNQNVHIRRGNSKEQLLGLHCWELDGEQFCSTEPGGCTFKETLTSGRKAERLHNIVDEQGRVRYWRVYTYPVLDGHGRMTNILEVRRDITNRTHMEMRLQQSEKLAAIGELATYIAHEIRNPLFAIGGFANSLLRSSSLDESAREKVSIVLEESKRLDGILKSILNFARPTGAREGRMDLNQVVRDTMDLMRFGCERRNISLELSLNRDIAKAKADPELIKQSLINLVKNAMEAMPEGGTLTVRTFMNEKYVYLEVEDNGRGIPVEIRDKVFNPFFSTKDKGSGLGLAMTKKILEDLGGHVELVSQEGKGTRVTLALPPVLAVGAENGEPFTLL